MTAGGREERTRRYTGRQITAMVVAVCLAVVAAPVSALAAAGQLVTISDPVHKSHRARVDHSGRLWVGDGGGKLTVNGTVQSRALPPARLWDNTYAGNATGILAGPTSSAINLTSLTVQAFSSPGEVIVYAKRVPGDATSCVDLGSLHQIWRAYKVPVDSPTVVSFPAPVQARPTPGHRVCLIVEAFTTSTISASGSLGG